MRAIPMGGCFNHPRKSRSESPAKKSLFGLCKLRRMSEFFFKSQGQHGPDRGLGVCLHLAFLPSRRPVSRGARKVTDRPTVFLRGGARRVVDRPTDFCRTRVL